MKERPILFSAPMVRALLDGMKTQTRRVVTMPRRWDCIVYADFGDGWWPYRSDDGESPNHDNNEIPLACPYGQPGDRLWVRETHCDARNAAAGRVLYRADGDPACRWTPAIHMPRAASRIDLEVTSVRVERLQDISEADAIAEGIERNWSGDLGAGPNGYGGEGWVPECGWRHYLNSMDGDPAYTAVESYRSLWEQINGPGSWDVNPWVWVVEFRAAR